MELRYLYREGSPDRLRKLLDPVATVWECDRMELDICRLDPEAPIVRIMSYSGECE